MPQINQSNISLQVNVSENCRIRWHFDNQYFELNRNQYEPAERYYNTNTYTATTRYSDNHNIISNQIEQLRQHRAQRHVSLQAAEAHITSARSRQGSLARATQNLNLLASFIPQTGELPLLTRLIAQKNDLKSQIQSLLVHKDSFIQEIAIQIQIEKSKTPMEIATLRQEAIDIQAQIQLLEQQLIQAPVTERYSIEHRLIRSKNLKILLDFESSRQRKKERTTVNKEKIATLSHQIEEINQIASINIETKPSCQIVAISLPKEAKDYHKSLIEIQQNLTLVTLKVKNLKTAIDKARNILEEHKEKISSSYKASKYLETSQINALIFDIIKEQHLIDHQTRLADNPQQQSHNNITVDDLTVITDNAQFTTNIFDLRNKIGYLKHTFIISLATGLALIALFILTHTLHNWAKITLSNSAAMLLFLYTGSTVIAACLVSLAIYSIYKGAQHAHKAFFKINFLPPPITSASIANSTPVPRPTTQRITTQSIKPKSHQAQI